jgi:phosphoribosylamine--glycine ligase
MRVLLIGKGGREHALAWKIKQSPLLSHLFVWPAGPVTALLGTTLPLPASADLKSVAETSRDMGIDLVICGPEAPLAEGLADQCRVVGIPTFGPLMASARLEAEKAFAKDMMAKAGIPTARCQVVYSEEECRQVAYSMLEDKGGAVLKASGLAAGKGVFVCEDKAAIEAGLKHLYHTDMRKAARQVVVEEILLGRECSYFAFVSTEHAPDSRSLGFAVDYKRLEDGDRGPNTGGMGCYAPVTWLPPHAAAEVEERVVRPLIRTLKAEGLSYQGCLYVGLMWSPDHGPQVVEFNVRLGDPEAQVLAALDDRDWLALMADCCGLSVAPHVLGESMRPLRTDLCAVAVVMAGETYPFGEGVEHPANLPLDTFSGVGGISASKASSNALDSLTFAAGVDPVGTDKVLTGSGRVLTVAARSETFEGARQSAYAKVEAIQAHWPRARYRKDIAKNPK